MVLANKKKIFIIAGLTLLPLVMAEVAFISSNWSMKPSVAEQETFVLNNDNAPTLSAGEGTMVDEKNVTWEYHNASDNPSGHVTLNHKGYFGISSSSSWGFTGIGGLTVNFTGGSGSELWLLRSTDGVNWDERETLSSGVTTTDVNNWRYIRFYHYDANLTSASLNVTSVTISYSCEGISSTDDVDAAIIGHVYTNKLVKATASEETSITSPKGDSTQAIRFQNNDSGTGNRQIIISLGDFAGTLGEMKSKKIEFDYYHTMRGGDSQTRSYPRISLARGTSSISSQIEQGGNTTKHNAYTATPINDDWWHIECYITSILALNFHTDDSELINGIIINDNYLTDIDDVTGFAVIDNLKVTRGTPAATLSNTTSSGGDGFMMRENYCGRLWNKVATSSNESVATVRYETDYVYLNKVSSGKTTITITYTLGCSREQVEVTKTLTIN